MRTLLRPSTPNRVALRGILTDRFTPGYDSPNRHVVYEWEDQIAGMTGLSLVDSHPARRASEGKVTKTLHRFPVVADAVRAWDAARAPANKSLYFVLFPQRAGDFSTRASVIPAIIDFWKKTNLNYFFRAYGSSPMVLISSREAFEFLQEKACPLDIRHFPLSLPDRHKLEPSDQFEKTVDVVMAGRANKTLLELMRRYEKDHPDVEYMFQEPPSGGGESLSYRSNKRGLIRDLDGRSSYVSLLRSAKVGFYSTPGMDGGETRTGGFNPVTPRLFEILAAGCHVVARYPDNADTRYFELAQICPSADSYEIFAATLDRALAEPAPIARNSAYLQKHYTSTRVAMLRRILAGLG